MLRSLILGTCLAATWGATAASPDLSPTARGDAASALTLSSSVSSVEPTAAPQAPVGSGASADDIAEKLANPIANLISLPFQFNYDKNTGAGNDGSRLTLNIQPVIPVDLSDRWLMISRTILPVIYQDDVVFDGASSQYGLGDITQSLFFSPKDLGVEHLTIGVGPAFLIPTGTNDSLGSGKWAAGPTAIVLVQKTPWTYGVLANHLWSFAGDSDRRSVNATFIQPFVSYGLGGGVQLALQAEASYDWNEGQWTIPVAAGASKVFKFGKLPVSLALQGRYWAEGPDGAPEWGARFVMTFVFPK